MARDYEIPLCGDCTLRPMDPETGQYVVGGLRIGDRAAGDDKHAVVVYSEDDPRINEQYALDEQADSSAAVRAAQGCGPLVLGLEATATTSFDRQIAQSQASQTGRICRLTGLLKVDLSLPENLLFKTTQTQGN